MGSWVIAINGWYNRKSILKFIVIYLLSFALSLFVAYYSAWGAGGMSFSRSVYTSLTGAFLPLLLLSLGRIAGTFFFIIYGVLVTSYIYLIMQYGLITANVLEAMSGTNFHQSQSVLTGLPWSLFAAVILIPVISGWFGWRNARFRPLLMGITGALVILPLCKEIPIRSGFAKIHGLPSMIALRFYRYVPGIRARSESFPSLTMPCCPS
ncbi:hypothetical protein, partial [Komagataeibacter europaeus]|uniref:hypothetical protein n=1 Tax=Komagataeibacter europaeus TaxID=33995 RepID=UPI002231B490